MRVVLVTEVTRTCPRLVPLRTKLTTGKPKPKFAKPLPVIVKLAGGEARSTGFGVMELTPGGGRVSLTVSEVLPTRPQLLFPDLGWAQISTSVRPARSTGTVASTPRE